MSATRGEPWEDAVARRTEVTGGLDDSAPAQRLRRAGVQVIRGTGRITAPGTVTVELLPGGLGGVVTPGSSRALTPDADKTAGPADAGGPANRVTTLTYSDLVIATGCEPVAPPIEGLSDIPAWTTAQSLSSPDLPRRLIVLGGGPAGCELTQAYASFGSQVTLVEAEPRLLPGEPAFAGEILAVALRRAGAEIRLGSRATKAERTADGLTLGPEDPPVVLVDPPLPPKAPAAPAPPVPAPPSVPVLPDPSPPNRAVKINMMLEAVEFSTV